MNDAFDVVKVEIGQGKNYKNYISHWNGSRKAAPSRSSGESFAGVRSVEDGTSCHISSGFADNSQIMKTMQSGQERMQSGKGKILFE